MFDFIGSVADIRDYVKKIELSEIRLEERSEMIDFYSNLIKTYPIASIEDGIDFGI